MILSVVGGVMSQTSSCKAWLVVGLLIALSACFPSHEAVPTPTSLPPPVSYEKSYFTVERGPIVSQFTVTGQVLPSRQDHLFFRASGYVTRVTVQEGDTVKAGELLAELQIDDLLRQLEQAHIDLEAAQEKLAKDARGRRYAIAAAQHQVNVQQIQVDLACVALEDAERATTQAELSLAMAEEQLVRLQARQADYDAEVLAARINLTRAEDALAQAQIEYQEALDRTWETQEVRDRYTRALQQAEWNHEIAQARYEQTLAAQEVYQHDLEIQALTVDQAEGKLLQLQETDTKTLELQLQLAEENLAFAKLALEEVSEEVGLSEKQAVERAQLTVERLEAQIAERQIIAPYDCIVLQPPRPPIQPGNQVQAFEPVFVVGDPTDLVIGTRRLQDRVDEIRKRADVEIHMSLAPQATERYEVKLMTDFLPLSSETDEGETTIQDQEWVYLTMLSPPEREKTPVGKIVYLLVVLGRSDDALLLPPETIRSFRGLKFVIVQEGEQRRRVDVQIGLESDERVEVIGDLKEGDQVVGP
jgi:multidrug efflux pump subunit AcrA (membrane-fusion protein)